jgi:hypothetical protein
VQTEFFLTFDFGIFYKKSKITQANEIINQGLLAFKRAVSLENEEGINYDEEERPLLTKKLKELLIAFSHFVIVDEYEIMLELIKGQLKKMKSSALSKEIEDINWLLRKFMIALDIHFYLKNGSLKNAAGSLIDFIATFDKYLTYQEKVKLVSTAFYMLAVARFGKSYLPDYALRFLDYGFQLKDHYNEHHVEDVLTMNDYSQHEGEENEFFDEEERLVIERNVESLIIEKVSEDKIYIEVLQMVITILTHITQDERSAYFKSQYIQIFNILMTATVNDSKKPPKVVELLTKGFELIANSSYDEYFFHLGLTDFNYSNA